MSDTAPSPLPAISEEGAEIHEAIGRVLAAHDRMSAALARLDAAIEIYKQDARRLAESLGAPAGRE